MISDSRSYFARLINRLREKAFVYVCLPRVYVSFSYSVFTQSLRVTKQQRVCGLIGVSFIRIHLKLFCPVTPKWMLMDENEWDAFLKGRPKAEGQFVYSAKISHH